jgi:transposase
MAHVADHLTIEELEQRYRACEDACASRHYHAIWLLAQGHTIAEVSALTSFVPRWIEQLQARYNALGPRALGDLRRNNGTQPSVLTPELLDQLRERLRAAPDGGLWTSGKVATWMAVQLGLEKLAPQRGWEALQAIGWSIQSPRSQHPNSAAPEQEAAFKKSSRSRSPRKPRSIPTSRSKYGRRMSIASA